MATDFIERDGFLGFKNSKDEKCGDSKLFENQNLENHLQNGVEKIIFKNERMRKWRMTHDPKVGM